MSAIAEFARELHERTGSHYERRLEPLDYPSKFEGLTDIRAIIFDVYGTLIDYWRPGLDDENGRLHILKSACAEVCGMFGFTEYLQAMNPDESPEKTLYDLYCGLIALRHEKASRQDITFTEIKVEDIWSMIILMLKRRGYDPAKNLPVGQAADLPRYIAYTYNFYSLGHQLYPGVADALTALRGQQIDLGIVSNAQFYTPIDLTLLLRGESGGAYDDFNELFDPDLTIFSYEHEAAKPDTLLFRRLYDALYERKILPQQTVFAGNDLTLDIEPASSAGMRTALFTGDSRAVYLHGREGEIVPDITFSDWSDLPRKISFFSGGAGRS